MDDARATSNSNVERILLDHVLDDSCGIATNAILILEEFARPDSFLGVSNCTAYPVAMFEQLVNDM